MNFISAKNILIVRVFWKKLLNVSPMSTKNITVEQGCLEGELKPLPFGGNYFSFKGIPYAAPPVGNLRFKAPIPPKPWSGIRSAKAHGNICPQIDLFTRAITEGSEDCLYLNVYTPAVITKPLAVMVYIHGGGFFCGSGDSDQYGPEFIVPHDVILVTINYRLEAFGFLCLDDPGAPGNAGLKDQTAALRWIKRNIIQFGGDPNNLTIFGESAGSVAVTLHMLSPMSKGLFHKAIAQSGTALNYWAISENAREISLRLAKHLGIEAMSTDHIISELQKVPAKDFINANMKIISDAEKHTGLPLMLCPVVERQFPGVESFLTEHPVKSLLEGKVANVPLICGYTSAEGMFNLGHTLKKKDIYNENFHLKVPKHLHGKIPLDKLKHMGKQLKQFYLEDSEISEHTKDKVVDLETDMTMRYGAEKFAQMFSEKFPEPVYVYEFDFSSERDILKQFFAPELKGASHADDLAYLFHTQALDIPEKDSKTGQMVYQITKMWTDFAKTGNPCPKNSMWKRYVAKNRNILLLSETISLRNDLHADRMAFCEEMYRQANFFQLPNKL